MKKQVYEIDEYGFIAEIYVKEFDDELVENFIDVSPPNGLYRAKWNGFEWVEDMSQEEIDSINNIPKPPSQEDRLKAVEDTILQILMEG